MCLKKKNAVDFYEPTAFFESKCDKNDTLLMLKIIVKILSTWTTLKIIVSKIWLDMRTFRVATHKKARDNIYVTGFVVNVIKRIPCL